MDAFPSEDELNRGSPISDWMSGPSGRRQGVYAYDTESPAGDHSAPGRSPGTDDEIEYIEGGAPGTEDDLEDKLPGEPYPFQFGIRPAEAMPHRRIGFVIFGVAALVACLVVASIWWVTLG